MKLHCTQCLGLNVSFEVYYYPNKSPKNRTGDDNGNDSWCYDCEEEFGDGTTRLITTADVILSALDHVQKTAPLSVLRDVLLVFLVAKLKYGPWSVQIRLGNEESLHGVWQ